MASQIYRLGAFELTAPIGKGGMAEVWSARHSEFGGTAAVKMITDQATDERYRQVFFKEVRAHARLEHPAIVRLLDYGHVTADDQPPPGVEDGHPYLVMEAADGTLGSGGAPADWMQLRAMLLQLLDGLAYSHARGVIHRDLKPDNVLRFGTGRAARYKLADFGIAHSLRREEHDLEASEATMGTPRYMSPEQFLGRWLHYGPPTDLYALGCMAYQMVTGAPPFMASRLVLLAMEHVELPMPRPTPRFAVPDGFENWLARLLEKSPADRFQWAAEAAHSLLELSDGFASEESTEAELAVESQPTELLSFLFEMTTNVDQGELVDWSAPTMASSGPVSMPPAFDEGERECVEPIARASIPFPRRWETLATASDHQVEGLGLFALREAPVVGMRAERDRLWDELHAVVTTQERRTILLEGGARAPLNELSEWLVLRAAETGAASGLKIFHSSAGGPREGLTGLLEDLFVSWALPDDDIRGRVESVLNDKELDSELRAFDIAVLTAEILRGRGADTRPSTVATQTERHRAIARALGTVRGDQPLLLLIENAGLGRDSVEFVRHITEEGVGAVLVVLAVRTVSQERARVAHRELEELAAQEFSTSLKVPDYDTEEQVQLLHELLPLVPQTRDRLVSATVGDPVMARLLLTDLIAQKALTPRPNGFVLSESSDLDLAARAVVVRRLESCWREQPDLALTLEAAAVLGLSPDPQELQRICQSRGLLHAGDLGPILEEHGLARSTEGRWWFVHDEVVQVLLERASQAGRLPDLHRAAGEVLLAHATPDAASLLRRAGEHLIAAGEGAEALGPLYDAARFFASRDTHVAEQLIEERRAILDVGSGSETDVIDQLNLQAQLIWSSGGDGSRDRALEALSRAERASYDRGAMHARRQLARLATETGDFEEAARHLGEATRLAELSAEDMEVGSCAFAAGYIAYRLGDFGRATTYLQQAIDRFEGLGAQNSVATSMSYLSAVHVAAGNLDAAEEAAQEAMRIARSCRALNVVAETASDLAEIARFRGNWGLARERYLEARRWMELAGSQNTLMVRFNLALVRVGERDWEKAEMEFSALVDEFDAAGWTSRIAPAYAGLAVCYLARRQSVEFDQLFDRLESAIGEHADRDLAWLLERGAEVVREDEPRQARLVAAARAQYERLGDATSAERVSALASP